MDKTTVDITRLLRDLEADIAEAEQRASEAARRLEYLKGQRDGVLLVWRASQERAPAIITEGEG